MSGGTPPVPPLAPPPPTVLWQRPPQEPPRAGGAAGEPFPAGPTAVDEIHVEAIHQELSRYRYCTTFVVEGKELDAGAIEAELDRLGDSLLVVGDPSALKVHVHTDEPGLALAVGTRAGVIDRIEIVN